MLGLHFESCSEFGLSFSFNKCALDHSSFYQTRIKKTSFTDCQLKDTDFTNCDVSSAILDRCDLSGATFDNTNLEKADLRSSYNYSIDPERNKIKKAKFSLQGIAGLLDKYELDIEG